MKKDKKILTVVISLLIVTIFAGPKVYRWYKPYRVSEDIFGINVPLTAKATLFEHHYYFFDSSGETKIVFDVSNLKKEMEQLLAEKNFIRSDDEELIIHDSPQFKTFFTDKKQV